MRRTGFVALLALTLFFLGASLAGAYTIQAVNFQQGLTKGGGAVAGDRSDPTLAEVYDPLTDDDGTTLNFVSLGFGGSLVLQVVNGAIGNGVGWDVTLYETTWGSNADQFSTYPEAANVYAYNGAYNPNTVPNDPNIDTNWVFLGTAQQDGSFDLGNLQSTSALLIVDVSDNLSGFFPSAADGYDVDGIVVHNAVPIPGAVWLLGSGLIGLVGLRRRFAR